MAPFLQFSDLTKTYPGVRALSGVSFGVAKGSVQGLLGENGAGKSTLIKILSGDISADGGEVRIDGKIQRYASTRDAFRAGVVVVHQELQLVPGLTVAENLRLGRFPAASGIVRFGELFADVGAKLEEIGIEVDPKTKVADLSIGARQMVEIAKAVMLDADVIALDEPTSSLSSRESEILFRLIERLRDQGKVILYISHRLDEIFRLCDGCTVLRDGRLAAHHADMRGVTRHQLVNEMVGREIADIWGWRERQPGKMRLEVDAIRGRHLPEPTSFSARTGEILGFFGLVGAGRSELMRLVYGADQPTGGKVSVDGQAMRLGDPRQSIREGLVLCPEDRKFDGIVQGRSVTENVTISSRRHYSGFGLIRPARETGVADRFIESLRIRTPSSRQDIVNLSGGNQQKVILARWLSESGIKVLLVDEPTRGIDVGAKSEIYEVLYGLAEQGLAIVMVSSELPEVMGVADRIIVMCERRIAGEFARAEFDEQAILAAALPDHADSQARRAS